VKVITKTGLILISSIIFYGCYYDHPPDLPLPSDISYATDIQPIWNANCISCHNGNLEPDLTTGNSYSALMALPAGSIVPGDAAGSELFQMLNGGGNNPMPPGSSIPQAQINLFGQWIDEGAVNN
jgi:mono/diheme cytochrome c family protein